MTSSDSHDVVTQITGGFGKWQLRSLIFIFLCKIPATWFMACISFTAPVPQVAEYFCIPDGQNDRNATSQWKKPFPLRELEEKTDREFYIDQCYYPYRRLDSADPLNNSTSPELKACEQFEHNAEYESLVTQFDLVCSREMLVSLTQAFHALGGLIGGLLALHILK